MTRYNDAPRTRGDDPTVIVSAFVPDPYFLDRILPVGE